ncbi:GNAT family N-acetyltransferase [Streptomyces sp. YC504]|uniref:GNAT family N-acetyltransferase n=1 Tax=Streptomyces mesophilus TaxID=1775132 RepID=A0A6G4XG75_9ACTN|nr:GNAT family N-acetyltransferase [Streptomyces mesophilus]NGO76182.1 GNAT family N-acetyltransferase [Streptomyces mesophilus]
MDAHVREMTTGDIDAVSEIRVRGWQFAYRGLMPQGHLDALDVEEDAAARRKFWAGRPPGVAALVAERGGRIVGFSGFGPTRDDDQDAGAFQVYAIYVHPEQIGTGAGRALMDATLDRCRTAGAPSVCLWVLTHNERARRFYERAGFTADGNTATEDVDGVPVPEVRYVRRLHGSGAP